MRTDKELLDFLQEQLERAAYTGRCICRESVTGRGWRLHETDDTRAVSDVREAINNYMDEVHGQ